MTNPVQNISIHKHLSRCTAGSGNVKDPEDTLVPSRGEFRAITLEIDAFDYMLVNELVNLVTRHGVPQPRREIRGRCRRFFVLSCQVRKRIAHKRETGNRVTEACGMRLCRCESLCRCTPCPRSISGTEELCALVELLK